MFSGIGGFREGLTRAEGFTCVGHCEIDKYANRSYNALFDTKGEWFIEDARKADPSAMRNHDVWIYVRCANSDPRIAFDRLYDLIDEAAGHGFLVRGTSFDHCSGNTLKDRIGLRTMLDAVENGRIEAVMVRDLEQISRNSYILVGVIEILRQNDVYLITTECDLNAELINSGLERFVGDRFTRASFGKPRFDVRLPLMDQF